jgi:hypothetical protein
MIEVELTTVNTTKFTVHVADGRRGWWLPKQHLEDWPDAGSSGSVIMPYWLGKEKDII